MAEASLDFLLLNVSTCGMRHILFPRYAAFSLYIAFYLVWVYNMFIMEQQPPRNEEDAQIIPFVRRNEYPTYDDEEQDVAAHKFRALLSKYKDEIAQLSDSQKKTFIDSLDQWPDDVELDEEYIKYALEEAGVRPKTKELGRAGLRLVSERSQYEVDLEASKARHPYRYAAQKRRIQARLDEFDSKE